MLKKCTLCGAKHAALLGVQMPFRVAGTRDCAPCQKWAKRKGFCSCSSFKNVRRRGTFEEDLQRCIFRGRCNTRDMFIRDVRRSGHWFPERAAFWSIRSSVLGRWFCVTGAALCQVITFAWQNFTQMEWKNCKTHWYEAVSSALNFPFLKEVSQNCFGFDVVIFENWGSLAELAELLRFSCCHLRKWRKPCRIASFSSLQIDRKIAR